MRRLATALVTFGFASLAWAQASPVGVWKTIDDKTGKPKALVRISEENGALTGKIEKLFAAAEEPGKEPICDQCKDDRKDKPLVGLPILNGLKKDESGAYSGGEILDPATGKIYRAKITLEEDGKKLNVRGYIGMPMLGRTQTWVRE